MVRAINLAGKLNGYIADEYIFASYREFSLEGLKEHLTLYKQTQQKLNKSK